MEDCIIRSLQQKAHVFSTFFFFGVTGECVTSSGHSAGGMSASKLEEEWLKEGVSKRSEFLAFVSLVFGNVYWFGTCISQLLESILIWTSNISTQRKDVRLKLFKAVLSGTGLKINIPNKKINKCQHVKL